MTPFPRNAGFTLIEMVMVITITAILGAVVAVFIVRPIESYQRLSLRGTLVDAAESSLRRMAGDIRNALPHSVRITNSGSGFALEMLPTLDGAKYNTTGTTASEKLVFNGDSDFDLIGTFSNAATLTTTGIRLVINNLGTTGNDVYTDAGGGSGVPGVITSTATAITISTVTGNHHVNLSPQYDFKGSSSTNQRLYVVTTPVSYLCDPATGLTRYANYPIQAAQPSSAAALAGATSAQVVGNVSGCSLSTTALDVRNRGVATIALSLSYQGEQITLIQQTGLNNSR